MIEVGMWIKYLPDNAFGKVIDTKNVITGGAKIHWLDLNNDTVEMINFLSKENGNFEIIGKLTPQEELVLRMKYA